MRETRRHTHGSLWKRDAAEDERRVVSRLARRLQCRAHGGSHSRRMRAESEVGQRENNGIVVGRRVCVDYDDYDMLEWTDGRGRGWGRRVTSITLNNARAAGFGGGGVVVSSSWLFHRLLALGC
jgi:hypothetical protein